MSDLNRYKELGLTNLQAFWAANTGPLIAARLHEEFEKNWQSLSVMSRAALLEYQEDRRDIFGNDRARCLWIVLNEFLEQAYPVGEGEKRNNKIVNWISDRYLNETFNGGNILCEDLYKIGEDLQHFEGLRKSGRVAGRHITDFKSLTALREFLKPFDLIRAKKQQQKLDRSLSPEQKQEIDAGTTIVYSGPEGRVVIVHSAAASKYWGNNTKWCISANKNNRFDSYDQNHIVMLLPSDSDKTALVNQQFYNSEDKKINAPDAAGYELLEAAKNSLSAAARDNLEKLIPDTVRLSRKYGDETTEQIIEFSHYSTLYKTVPDEILNNMPVMIEIIRRRGEALYHGSADLKKNQELILEIARKNLLVTKYVDPALLADPKFMLKLVAVNGKTLEYASDEIKNNKRIVSVAVRQNGHALYHANPRFLNDKSLVIAAFGTPTFSGEKLEKRDLPLIRDRDVIMASLNTGTGFIDKASDEMRRDRAFMLDAIGKCALAYTRAHASLKDDPEFIREALRRNGRVLEYVPEEYKGQKEYALIALQSDAMAVMHLSDTLKEDKEFIFKAMRLNPLIAFQGYHYPDILRGFTPEESKEFRQLKLEGYRIKLDQGNDLKVELRHKEALWGDAERVLSAQADQIAYLQWLETQVAPKAQIAVPAFVPS